MPPPLGEFDRIDRFLKPLTRGFAGALDLTDDAAVFGAPPGHELVVTTDAMVAGVHFLPDDPPADIAAKLLRVNLSDLAAMGAAPLAYTLVTALPRGLDEGWLGAFAEALGQDQARYGIHLAGGDSVSTAGPVVLSVTAFGIVPKGRALRRGTGRHGDDILATGCIGDAALGLMIVQGRLDVADPADRAYLIGRLRRPEPRLSVAPDLRDLATSAIDVSDGMIADLGHLCAVSGWSAIVEAARVPLSPAARRVLARQPELLAALFTGGDDYELLFTAAPESRAALADLAQRHTVAITAIGRMTGGDAAAVTVLDDTGRGMPLATGGWQHF